jgi:chloramphenicol 3-O-phosphotransferase
LTPVFVVTGPSAAGKSTVGRLLAERFERGVHLESDFFRRSIVSGRAEVTPELRPEALDQLRLRYRLGAATADAYHQAGFAVVWEDVIAGPLLEEAVGLVRSRPLHVAVLLPSAAAVAAREEARQGTGYEHWLVDELHRGFADGTPRLGLWIDTSEQTPQQTADEILERREEALVEA